MNPNDYFWFCASSRNELFAISGIRGNYPQFFFVHPDGSTSFYGGYDKVSEVNEATGIPDDILEQNPEIETWPKVFGTVVATFDWLTLSNDNWIQRNDIQEKTGLELGLNVFAEVEIVFAWLNFLVSSLRECMSYVTGVYNKGVLRFINFTTLELQFENVTCHGDFIGDTSCIYSHS